MTPFDDIPAEPAPPKGPVPGGVIKGGFGEVWSLAYPVVITMASMSIMGLVDTFFMGFIGTPQQGATGLGAVLSWTLMSFFNGTITASNTFVAQHFGAKKYAVCGNIVWQSFFIALLATAVILTAIVPNIDVIISAIGASDEVTGFACEYMNVRLLGAVFVFANFCVVSFLRGIGDTRTPMKVTLVVNVLNVAFTYLFVFGKLGLPALGVGGAALGTIISQFVAMAIYLYLFFKKSTHLKFSTRRFRFPKWSLLKRFLKVGLPMGVWWVLEMGGFTVFTMFVSTLGDIPLAGHQIVRQMVHLSFLPGVALGVSATTLMGQYIGAGDIASAERSAKTAIKIGLIIMCSMGGLFVVMRYQVAELFNRDPRVIALAADLFLFAAVFQTMDALGTVSSGAIRGAGDTRWPMVVSLLMAWLFFVPSIIILGKVLGYGIYGAWTGATIYICILGLLMFYRFKSGKWKNMKI